MPLINTALPNLIQGVSQQPDVLRYEGQCSVQENALSSVVKGLQKRPPTEYVSTILTTSSDDSAALLDSFVKFIERDKGESYCIIIDGAKLRIFRVELPSGVTTPVEASIKVNNETYTTGYPLTSSDYLYSATSHQNIKTLTIGDTTILTNTALPVSQGAETSDALADEAFVFIKQGDYEKEYVITLHYPTQTDRVFEVRSADDNEPSHASTSVIRDQFLNVTPHAGGAGSSVTDMTGFASAVGESGLLIDLSASTAQNSGEAPTGISVSDGLANTGLGAVHIEVESISDLPKFCKNGFQVKVRGDSSLNEDDYYTKFETSNGKTFGNGSWRETIAPSIKTSIGDNAPVALVNTAENTFELRGLGLTKRAAGDNILNPFPSFVGSSISNSFLFKSRLGFLAEDAVIMSEAGFGPSINATSYYVNSSGDSTHTNGYYYPLYLDSSVIYGDFTTFTFDAFPNTTFYRPDSNAGFHASDAPTTGEISFTSESAITVNKEVTGFNFFRTTVTQLLDSDPIDVRASSREITTFRSAQAFQENLMIFSDHSQFVLKGGELLTPSTVSITQATNFDYEETVDPLALGSYLYFPFKRGDYSGIRAYTVNSTTDIFDSDEITQHVPRYIPKDITSLTGSTNDGIIAALSGSVTVTDQGVIDTTYTTSSIAGTSHQFIGGGDLIYHTTAYDNSVSMITTEDTDYTSFDGTVRTLSNSHRFPNFVSAYSGILGHHSGITDRSFLSNGTYEQMTTAQATASSWPSARPYFYRTSTSGGVTITDMTADRATGFSTLNTALAAGSGYTIESFATNYVVEAATPAQNPIIVCSDVNNNNILAAGFYGPDSDQASPHVNDRKGFIIVNGTTYVGNLAFNAFSVDAGDTKSQKSTHIALVGDADEVKLYIENILAVTVTASLHGAPLNQPSDSTVKAIQLHNNPAAHYGLHYARIYRKKLSTAERNVNYNSRYN